MDNRHIDLSLTGRSDFEVAMKLAVCNNATIGYCIENNTMLLYWCKSEKMTALPYGMRLQEIINFVWGWLEANPPDGPRPDHDGDNEKGYRIFNDSWNMVGGEYQAYIAITPIWAMYGK